MTLPTLASLSLKRVDPAQGCEVSLHLKSIEPEGRFDEALVLENYNSKIKKINKLTNVIL
jgi:hypothetical protein